MAVLIDTNVISDVLFEDPDWLQWSIDRLMEYEGQLQINPAIYAELCYPAESSEEIDIILGKLSLTYVETPRHGLYLAAQAYKTYRSRGGTKSAPLPDFFIGGHAAALKVPLITRDVSRYQTYFPQVKLIHP
jgi:predicted nucleic acid-binding protein